MIFLYYFCIFCFIGGGLSFLGMLYFLFKNSTTETKSFYYLEIGSFCLLLWYILTFIGIVSMEIYEKQKRNNKPLIVITYTQPHQTFYYDN